MNLQDYMMSESDKQRLLKQLESDIGFEDEALDKSEVANTNNEVDDESDLF